MRRWFIGILLGLSARALVGQTFETPFLGQVLGVKDYPIAVRLSPPNVSGGSYTLGSYVCAAFPGTTFYATDKAQLATGETWYFIQIAQPTAGQTGCTPNLTGWMVGQLKDGRSAIAVMKPGMTPSVGTARTSPPRPQPTSVKTLPTGGGQVSWYVTYPLLVFGTLIATIVLTWERNRRVNVRDLAKGLVMFEFAALASANVVALRVLAPAYQQVEPNAWVAKMLQQLTGTALGDLLLGFILAIVLMKSVSFAAPITATEERARTEELPIDFLG